MAASQCVSWLRRQLGDDIVTTETDMAGLDVDGRYEGGLCSITMYNETSDIR
jgi:hypothetical protein